MFDISYKKLCFCLIGLFVTGICLVCFSVLSYAQKPTSACLEPNTKDACTDISCCTWDGSLKGGTCIDENAPLMCCSDGTLEAKTTDSHKECQISLGWKGNVTHVAPDDVEYFDQDNDGENDKKLVKKHYYDNFAYKIKDKYEYSQCGSSWTESETSGEKTKGMERYTKYLWYEPGWFWGWSLESENVDTKDKPQFEDEC